MVHQLRVLQPFAIVEANDWFSELDGLVGCEVSFWCHYGTVMATVGGIGDVVGMCVEFGSLMSVRLLG